MCDFKCAPALFTSYFNLLQNTRLMIVAQRRYFRVTHNNVRLEGIFHLMLERCR